MANHAMNEAIRGAKSRPSPQDALHAAEVTVAALIAGQAPIPELLQAMEARDQAAEVAAAQKADPLGFALRRAAGKV